MERIAGDGGRKASNNGRIFESLVEDILIKYHQIYSKQDYVGIGIYGTRIKSDFILFHKNCPEGIIIEVKHQGGYGSVDEKLPYLIENIKHFDVLAIIVYGGGGHREGSIKWLKSKIDNNLIGVFTLSEFENWMIKSMEVK